MLISLWSHESSKSNFIQGGLEKEKLKKDALQINAWRTKIIVWKGEGENLALDTSQKFPSTEEQMSDPLEGMTSSEMEQD